MKSNYMVVCNITVNAKDDDTAREIVYDACRITGMQVHINHVTLDKQEENK